MYSNCLIHHTIKMFNILRLLYSCAATIVGIFGIYTYYLEYNNNYISSKICTDAGDYLKYYLLARFIIGCIQIPLHNLIITPARYYNADNFPLLNKKGYFYQFISHCNMNIAVLLLYSGYIISSYTSCLKSNYTDIIYQYLIMELCSFAVLSFVLTGRVLGIATGNTNKWFYLAWSDSQKKLK